MKLFRKPFAWAICYSLLLTLFASYLLLDTFVIPHSQQTIIPASSAASGSQSSAKTASQSDANGVFTENSYQDDNLSISISTQQKDNTQIYIADIQLSSIEYLKTALAQNTFGRNIKQTTSSMAEEHNAIFAINGDYYGFRNSGFVLRNGTLYRSTASSRDALVIWGDGSFETVSETDTDAQTLLDNGALQVFSFGPALLQNSSICVDQNTEVDQAKNSNPRTAIGIINTLHYLIIVSDGRTNQSEGLSLYQLAQVFQEQGCSLAYNLDGGGSSTMWFNGSIVNVPTDGRNLGERQVSDIVYIGY